MKVVDLHSGYGEAEIIRGVSFELREKELLCIIGPNGAGKSTLLKTLFGIVKAKHGKIFFKGEDITNRGPLDRLKMNIVYIPQGRNVFPMMSVEENLEMGAYIREDNKVKQDMERIYERYPILREKRKQMAGTLSGGEQQILQFARAMLLSPSLMFVDEPTAGLSPKHASMVFNELLKIREDGVAIILVEHNAKKALSIADRGLVLELGVKKFEGTGKELLANEKIRKLYLGG